MVGTFCHHLLCNTSVSYGCKAATLLGIGLMLPFLHSRVDARVQDLSVSMLALSLSRILNPCRLAKSTKKYD